MQRASATESIAYGLPFVAAVIVLGIALASTANAAKPFCGDNKCTGQETVVNCPLDCTAGAICGDGICDAGEDCETCETDCGQCPAPVCNNDGVCNAGEDCASCPGDCNGVTSGKPSGRYCCGDDTCDAGLCGPFCGSPMQAVCGNGQIETGEQCDDGNLANGDGCDALCQIEPATVPENQFNIGDSIGEGEAANGTIGQERRHTVWSTGYSLTDIVNTINERYDALDPSGYYENNEARDGIFNQAASGDKMAQFDVQAQRVVSAAQSVPSGKAGQVTVLLGANDVCADSLAQMTDLALFESQYRAGLDTLAANEATRDALIHVSGIPAIYWLWEGKRDNLYCRALAWPFVPCQNLLDNASNDCASSASTIDPDNIYPGDGPNCVRRKTFHAKIRDEYNPKLESVLAEYRDDGRLPNATYIDILDVRFEGVHVNSGDCFHPSREGHALLAEKEFCRTAVGQEDPQCTP